MVVGFRISKVMALGYRNDGKHGARIRMRSCFKVCTVQDFGQHQQPHRHPHHSLPRPLATVLVTKVGIGNVIAQVVFLRGWCHVLSFVSDFSLPELWCG